MMSWGRVRSVLLYAWYHLTHSMETWVDLLWFPLIELITFGLFVSFLRGSETGADVLILSGVILWEIVRVVQYSITVGVMWDIWSNSFSTLFVSPLQVKELITGQAIAGFFKALGVLFLLSMLSLGLFHFSPLAVGPMILVYFLLLTWFSMTAGIFVLALILRFGTDIQSFSWSLIFMFQPISAVFYPVEAIPESIRWVAYLSPITYAMQAFRAQFSTGIVEWSSIGWSVVVNAIYFVITLLIFKKTLAWSKKTGAFARMEM